MTSKINATKHLLSSSKNAKRLREAISQLNAKTEIKQELVK